MTEPAYKPVPERDYDHPDTDLPDATTVIVELLWALGRDDKDRIRGIRSAAHYVRATQREDEIPDHVLRLATLRDP